MQELEKCADKVYHCVMCQYAWTQLDVIDSVGEHGFLCLRCHADLRYDRDQTNSLMKFENQTINMRAQLSYIDIDSLDD